MLPTSPRSRPRSSGASQSLLFQIRLARWLMCSCPSRPYSAGRPTRAGPLDTASMRGRDDGYAAPAQELAYDSRFKCRIHARLSRPLTQHCTASLEEGEEEKKKSLCRIGACLYEPAMYALLNRLPPASTTIRQAQAAQFDRPTHLPWECRDVHSRSGLRLQSARARARTRLVYA